LAGCAHAGGVYGLRADQANEDLLRSARVEPRPAVVKAKYRVRTLMHDAAAMIRKSRPWPLATPVFDSCVQCRGRTGDPEPAIRCLLETTTG
jgi:hypothetical protein